MPCYKMDFPSSYSVYKVIINDFVTARLAHLRLEADLQSLSFEGSDQRGPSSLKKHDFDLSILKRVGRIHPSLLAVVAEVSL